MGIFRPTHFCKDLDGDDGVFLDLFRLDLVFEPVFERCGRRRDWLICTVAPFDPRERYTREGDFFRRFRFFSASRFLVHMRFNSALESSAMVWGVLLDTRFRGRQ